MVIWTSLQACGVVLPFAISTSICRSSVTICSGLYLLIDMTGLPPQVNSLSFHLVQKSPVRSLFWGWFRCFIQYAFYQVVAAAVVYVIGNLMLGALRLPPAGTLSTVQLIAWFPVLFITFLASIYVLLKIPSLTNHIFSGTAGGSSAGLLDAPAAVLNRVM